MSHVAAEGGKVVSAERLSRQLAEASTPAAADRVAILAGKIAEALRQAGANAREANGFAVVAVKAGRKVGQLLGPAEQAMKAGKANPLSADKGLSVAKRHRYRMMAAIPDAEFAADLAKRARGEDIITRSLYVHWGRTLARDLWRIEERDAAAWIAAERTILHTAIQNIAVAALASATVATVIADPPYADDARLFADLGRFAMRVLATGGWCVALVGYLFLDRVIADLCASGLRWQYLLTALFPGGMTPRIHPHRLYSSFKPILVLQKEPLAPTREWHRDVIKVAAGDYDKSAHEWQQPEPLFRELVERFSRPGDLVADPFAGSGTTLRAAIAAGRHAWGADDGSADHLRHQVELMT